MNKIDTPNTLPAVTPPKGPEKGNRSQAALSPGKLAAPPAQMPDLPSAGESGERFAATHDSGPAPKPMSAEMAKNLFAIAPGELDRLSRGSDKLKDAATSVADIAGALHRAVASHTTFAGQAIALLSKVEHAVQDVVIGRGAPKCEQKLREIALQQFSKLLATLQRLSPHDAGLGAMITEQSERVAVYRDHCVQATIDMHFRVDGLSQLVENVQNRHQIGRHDMGRLLAQGANAHEAAHGASAIAQFLRDMQDAMDNPNPHLRWDAAANAIARDERVEPEERSMFARLVDAAEQPALVAPPAEAPALVAPPHKAKPHRHGRY